MLRYVKISKSQETDECLGAGDENHTVLEDDKIEETIDKSEEVEEKNKSKEEPVNAAEQEEIWINLILQIGKYLTRV